jgi:hypothetical protein
VNARDELARLLAVVALDAAMTDVSRADDLYDAQADVLIAEGWRKMPSREQLIAVLYESRNEYGAGEYTPDEQVADAILALMGVDR